MKIIVLISFLSLFIVGCGGCSQSGRSKNRSANENRSTYAKNHGRNTNVVKMRDTGGVYEVPIEINGANMNFIFDTGASDITISAVEAIFLLKQGALTEDDIIGTEYYQIADGSISEGTVINLKTVKIGNKELNNVKASVIHNKKAPLLLGQSALAQFGKVSIDYKRKEIVFD